ncbi:hypothetical protein B9Z55_008990 [Caenorhabditis nigoni]|uniref:Uncharacterized protein n=1 Tax=Caenorhabditis nigoni TaxID=1611254 RepID=A0A2G5UQJ7_9PELO|nr:hypothetical protein B9Z55_008990 [Caenorhabditis nigoni]
MNICGLEATVLESGRRRESRTYVGGAGPEINHHATFRKQSDIINIFDGAQYLENVPEFGYFLDFDEDDEEEEDEEGEYFLLDGNYDEELIEAENREIRQEVEEQFDFFRNFWNGQNVEVHQDS